MKSREMAASVLSGAGLRLTRQRLLLAHILFDRGDRHVTAEQLHAEAAADGATISLATIYNTLHQFQAVGLLREVIVESGGVYFDTNTTDHHHFYIEASGRLLDIPGDLVDIGTLPEIPQGFDLDRVDVVIRLREEKDHAARHNC